MKIAGKIEILPIFMKIGESERSLIEIIIFKYQHPLIRDLSVIMIYVYMKIISHRHSSYVD